VHQAQIAIDPQPDGGAIIRDFYGNEVHQFSILQPHGKLTIAATSIVELNPFPLPEPAWTSAWESVRNGIREPADRVSLEAFDFTGESPYVVWNPDIWRWAVEVFEPGRRLLEAAVELNARIHSEFTYLPRSTTIDTSAVDVFRMRTGVCQDFAHVMIAALRSIGLAARYVSGYLRTGANYTGADASHAWVSVFVPPAGWVDLDPTNNVIPADGHVTLAWGRDYGDVAPVKGVTLGGGDHRVDVEVCVKPVSTDEVALIST
jgi:transglutaminase-like putative cysteine protease